MKIPRILDTGVELPPHEAACQRSGGKAVTCFDSTMVEMETDAGLVGHGGGCPLSPFHLPAPAEAVRAGLPELGPHILAWASGRKWTFLQTPSPALNNFPPR
ncbi:MAG: hypothetical protein V4675_08815 [Verrucomicrobiota bacterium]